jgi:hypothetical protein
MIIYLQNSKHEITMLFKNSIMLKNYVIMNISLKLKIVNYSHQNSVILYSVKHNTVYCHCRSRIKFYYIYIVNCMYMCIYSKLYIVEFNFTIYIYIKLNFTLEETMKAHRRADV